MLDELIKQKLPLQKKPNMPKYTAISNEEANVIRYAAGYTLCTMKKNVGTSAHRLKEEIVACIMDLLADEEDTEEEEVAAEWVTAVNTGGLWHIKSGTFFLFCAIEEELRSYLKISRVKEISDGPKCNLWEPLSAIMMLPSTGPYCAQVQGTRRRMSFYLETWTCGSQFEDFHLHAHGWKCSSKQTRWEHTVQRL